MGLSSTTSAKLAPKLPNSVELTQNNNDDYAVQEGHLKSPIFVQIESPYAHFH